MNKEERRLVTKHSLKEGVRVQDYEYFKYAEEYYQRRYIVEYFDDFFKLLKNIKGLSVLDIGSGIGTASKRLLEQGNEVFSLDINYYMMQYAKKKKNIKYPINGSAETLPIKSNSIDVVLFLDVIEHLEHRDRALREIRRVLRPGGRLYLITCNGIYSKIIFWGKAYDPTHIHEYTWYELKKTLQQAGFKINSAYACGIPLLNRLSQRFSRKLARMLSPLVLPIACPAFWVMAEKA